LLVDTTYKTESILGDNPAMQMGVITWDEKPIKELDKTLNFSGYTRFIKNAAGVDPGPNNFSDDTSCVILDNQNDLHLRTSKLNGIWNCAEIYLNKSLGYGVYTYQVISRVDNFNFNVTFSGLLYESVGKEIDIEFSKVLAGPNNMQFVAQPFNIEGNIFKFTVGSQTSSTHQIVWYPDSVVFKSWYGLNSQPADSNIIKQRTYKGISVPPSEGLERMHFNLWLFNGNSPQSGQRNEVIIKNFAFQAF
jgi:hypothetical protein